MTRAEHLAWCKRRALGYAERGDLAGAVASMSSDLGKHPDTAPSANPGLILLGMMAVHDGRAAVRHWIEGFG